MAERSDRATVSLITVVMNGGPAFARTIDSIRAQTYGSIEHIVIDGGSTDGTLDLIRRHRDRIAHWVSEPDRGISHAFNKGIAAATGRYVGIVNADDWLEPDQIEKAVAALEAEAADFVFGDLAYHAPDGTPLHVIEGDPGYASTIRNKMPALNHPTMLARRSVFETIGGFDEGLKLAMDYDWVLRAHLAGHRGVYEPSLLGHMTLDGVSDRRFIDGLAEVRRIAQRHGQGPFKAWPIFGFRVVKGIAQRLLQRHATKGLYDGLRGLANPHYRKTRPSASAPSEAAPRR